jgi:retron-type reverse transcriptase
MKRLDDIYSNLCKLDTLEQAERKARRGKEKTRGVIAFDRHRDDYLRQLQQDLINGTFKTSKYHIFKVFEPKERDIYELPYYPDRIVHHAIMLVLGKMFANYFESNTYSSIPGKGGSALRDRMVRILKKDKEGTRFALQMDVHKCFNSINHQILKDLLKRKIKDGRMLALLYEIIDSAEGLPIGNYLSQTLANFYFGRLDTHFASRYYFRYTDDIVILSASKEQLHEDLTIIRSYMVRLRLQLKPNWQIYPVDARGIDYAGYVFFHGYTLIRKRIKINLLRTIKRYADAPLPVLKSHLGGYCGWLMYTNSINFNKKYKILWKHVPQCPCPPSFLKKA